MKKEVLLVVLVLANCLSTSIGLSFIRSIRRTGKESSKANPSIGRVQPGSELFPPAGQPYIPSGLTAQQYADLKQKEAAKMAKMDFGAWGPRFKRTERPTDDLMVLSPLLWTRGLSSNPATDIASATRTQALNTVRMRLRQVVDMLPSFLLTYISLDILHSAAFLTFSAHEVNLPNAALTLFRTLSFHRQIAFTTIWKILPIKIALSICLTTGFVSRAIENESRRRLWTQRRLIVTTLLAELTIWALWTAILTIRFAPVSLHLASTVHRWLPLRYFVMRRTKAMM